jgi:hypothetical protein
MFKLEATDVEQIGYIISTKPVQVWLRVFEPKPLSRFENWFPNEVVEGHHQTSLRADLLVEPPQECPEVADLADEIR